MKKLLGILFILSFSNSLYAQLTNEFNGDSTDIYVHTFGEYCKQVKAMSPSLKKLYIRSHGFYTKILPSSYLDISINRLTDKELSRLCRKNKYVFVSEMIVLRTKNNGFYITVIPFKVHKSRKGFEFVNNGALNFNYIFDFEKSTFHLQDMTGAIPKLE